MSSFVLLLIATLLMHFVGIFAVFTWFGSTGNLSGNLTGKATNNLDLDDRLGNSLGKEIDSKKTIV